MFAESTELSRAILAGYPESWHRQEGKQLNTKSDNRPHRAPIWAFAVTSQKAVHAFENALQLQPNSAIREAWLEIPIYCLTGATLTSVQKAGFKTINSKNPYTDVTSSDPASTSTIAPMTTYSFDTGVQLVEFILSADWPTVHPSSASSDGCGALAPELWFLSGEINMKTLTETLTAYQKPFKEIVVYRTERRPGFDQELLEWLNRNSSNVETKNNEEKRTCWLVGFSPRGVDMSIPTLKQFILQNTTRVDGNDGSGNGGAVSGSGNTTRHVEIRWGAIGTTTMKRIQEHLLKLHEDIIPTSNMDISLSMSVAVARAPKPEEMAEAILP
ncbi:hypothetical protein BX616_006244 [Lobosporangium transversale]|uniref:Uncharacterized protein n=1 Tax=Lobosporangium transversale TaxID=64571 RepID=A0A1Y2GB87_9FUNG|nr:hypothetical protein BCR41DRAFT_400281 [Lobosporangium transversale]KAF9897064.1 hypothetical protein BX616_006244 [Lobosporangium transversale]ORZ06140.1 hypothetical protein BCR41DRAFT_400281 [Lobosporangium transversale]|eukprot:XP_021877409.1 hypothetical protein BCR41DRAFT_400281 [Lobosporangium transversale]